MSHAELDAGMVAGACRDYLRAREQRIAAEKEEIIACWVGHKKWRWSKPMTREQAMDFCSEELYYAEITGGRWARDIRNLQSLAEMAEKSNTLVTVDADLASMLSPHFG
jgi:predicted HTH transcriptional regulator